MLSGQKTMIIRGATGRKMPYGRVQVGDILYFMENDGSGQIKSKAAVTSVFNSDKMDQETAALLVKKNQQGLQLTPAQIKRWAGKRYLVLIEVSNPEVLEPFRVDKSEFGNMDDWLLVGEIDRIKIGSDQG